MSDRFQMEVAESAYCWDLATVEDIFGLEIIRYTLNSQIINIDSRLLSS